MKLPFRFFFAKSPFMVSEKSSKFTSEGDSIPSFLLNLNINTKYIDENVF